MKKKRKKEANSNLSVPNSIWTIDKIMILAKSKVQLIASGGAIIVDFPPRHILGISEPFRNIRVEQNNDKKQCQH